ncbi:MAG: sulfatase [Opitutae bacterium]|nr:sulfatase [Opitutae bacterium]|tara:strand:- start:1694 stop:3142 length:1449 start_codon:yes stop_codon:yes gene_type:complete
MFTRLSFAFFLFAGCLSAKPPNILLIVSEDNGPEMSCYGEPFVKTPVLDKLATEGTRFDRAYVPQAGCSQSRAAYLTGLYPHQNGQIGLATWKFRMYRADTPNMVTSLKKAGYRTGIIGKLHVNPASAFPFDFKAIPEANFSRNKQARYAEQAERFFKADKKPFFLSINYPDAHRPFIKSKGGLPAKPLAADQVKTMAYIGLESDGLRQQVADYYNCMARLDALIGQLLIKLKASGKYDDTLIVYIGDHGADLIRGKRTCYEGGVRVPFIVRLPKGRSSQVRRELVSTLDLFPTFLEVSGAKAVAGLPGRSLLPLLRGGKPKWRQYMPTEFHLHSAHNYYPQRAIRNERYKLIENLQPGEVDPGYDFTVKRFFGQQVLAALPKAQKKVQDAYALMKRPPKYQLYDLQKDPYEFVNLADDSDHHAILNELSAELTRWRLATRDPMINPENVTRLKKEIDGIRQGNDFSKSKIGEWKYPDYFFK